MLCRPAGCLLLCLLPALKAQTPPENQPYPEWSVFYGASEFESPASMLPHYLKKLASAQTSQRHAVIASLTPASLQDYRAETLAKLRANIGSFPDRTPLRAVTTGVLDREGYRVEKVVFESRPQYYVTANVYVPDGPKGPFPAVLCPVGHWGSGKYLEDYQRLGMWLARHGFITLVYDGPGQGERLQYFDAVMGRSLVDPGTSEYYVTIEHWLSAGPNMLASDNFASYVLWDGVRSIDYLSARPDVDRNRIACTGVSGGGLQTELLAALDERIKVAIPACYGGCAMETPTRPGLSAADVDALIAPRPLLMLEATGDARDEVLKKRDRHQVISQLYTRLNAPDRTRFLIAEGPHGYLASMREEALVWLNRWLGAPAVSEGKPRAAADALESETTLRCTTTGQVTTALGSRTVLSLSRHDLEAAHFRSNLPAAREQWPAWRRELVEKISSRIGYSPSAAPLDAKVLTRVDKGDYVLEKIAYSGDEGIFVPALLLLPKTAGPHPAVIFVNESGKSAGPIVSDYLAPLAAAGFAALSVDTEAMGEIAPTSSAPYNQRNYRGLTGESETDLFYEARSIGQTLLGIRVRDIHRGVDYLATRTEIDQSRISAAGQGMGGLLVLFAAALDERLGRVISDRALASYAALIEGELYAHRFGTIVPGVLREFDLPELCATIAPRPLLLLNSVDERQHRVEPGRIERTYQPSAQVYRLGGAGQSFRLAQTVSAKETLAEYISHLRR